MECADVAPSEPDSIRFVPGLNRRLSNYLINQEVAETIAPLQTIQESVYRSQGHLCDSLKSNMRKEASDRPPRFTLFRSPNDKAPS